MAENLEPPPLFDEKNDDEDDDLFASALQSHDGTNGRMTLPDEDLFSGGGTEIKLDDDDDDDSSSPPPIIDLLSSTSAAAGQPLTTTAAVEVTAAAAAPAVIQAEAEKEAEQDGGDQFIEISVTDPLKIGEGMSAFVAYKVCTRTNLGFFKKRQFHVVRRFSDFLGLHDKMAEKHAHLGRFVPPAPEKSVVGATKIKMSKESGGGGDNGGGAAVGGEFVEKRRFALERFLNRVAAHPVLRTDPDFRDFLEVVDELPRATSTSALSGAGMLRLFNRVGDTVSKIAFKMDESDPWFEEKQQQLDSLDQQLRKLHGSVETLVHFRRELAQSSGAFSKSVALLSNGEEHTTLSRALSQLADVEDKVERVQQAQACSDLYLFAELLKDYIGMLAVVRDAFHQRAKVMQTWQHAQQALARRREHKARLELSNRNGAADKMAAAREDVVEWEAKCERGQEEFENISKMIRKEMERFEYNRTKDFKDTIVKYLESLMNNQQQLIKCWEAFLPEAKAIALR